MLDFCGFQRRDASFCVSKIRLWFYKIRIIFPFYYQWSKYQPWHTCWNSCNNSLSINFVIKIQGKGNKNNNGQDYGGECSPVLQIKPFTDNIIYRESEKHEENYRSSDYSAQMLQEIANRNLKVKKIDRVLQKGNESCKIAVIMCKTIPEYMRTCT